MPERIGVFGGSFDPPHLGHLIAAQAVAEQCELDLVLWVPTGDSYHKTGTSSTDHRLAMTELAVADNPRFALSRVDAVRPGPTYSIDTITDLRRRYPTAEFTLILGSDAYAAFDGWHRATELRQLVSLAVMRRFGAPQEFSTSTSLRWVEIPAIGISSTQCRSWVGARRDIRYCVPPAVNRYIAEHALYSESNEPRV